MDKKKSSQLTSQIGKKKSSQLTSQIGKIIKYGRCVPCSSILSAQLTDVSGMGSDGFYVSYLHGNLDQRISFLNELMSHS